MWVILKEMNATVSEARIDVYLQQFQNAQMLQDKSISLFGDRRQGLENKLTSIGHVIPYMEKRRALLRGLSLNFDISASIIRATGKSYHESVAFLISANAERCEDQKWKIGLQGNASLHVSNNSAQCTFCSCGGHDKAKCYYNPESTSYRPQLAGKRAIHRKNYQMHRQSRPPRRSQKPTEDTRQNQAAYVDVSFMSTVKCSRTILEGTFKDKWYIDSGASAHMCNYSSTCDKLETYEGRNVSVRTGDSTAVLGS